MTAHKIVILHIELPPCAFNHFFFSITFFQIEEIAQTVPNQISSLTITVASLFYPEQTKYYAQGKRDELVDDIKSGMKVSGFFTNIVFVVLLFSNDIHLESYSF